MLNSKKIFYTLKPKQHLAVALSFSLIILPIQLQALPSGQRVVAGSASFKKTLNNLNITTSNKAIINYNSFNIGAKEGVRFIQPSANSVVLNRVIQANPSSILGSLNANGMVFLVNPAGIYFGANSVVNANSFLATTLNISDNDFLNGNYQFQQMKNMAKSYIIQKGSISVSPQGFVILASPFVSSEGSIMAKAGQVTIGATDNFYIQFDSNGLIRYDYQKNAATDDKPIVMPKVYADSIMDNVINTDKFNDKLQIVQNGDKIELAGGSGTAMVSGKINTDATADATAGTIEVKAQNNALLLNHAKLQSNAAVNGNGGNILVYGDKFAYGDQGATLEAKGGELSGNGGFAELSAKNSVLFNGTYVDTSAQNGNRGTFLIDPTDLVIGSDVSINSNYNTTADNSITLDNGVSISTNGGNIDFSAPTILLNEQSKLLAGTGDIVLDATSNTLNSEGTALSSISINGATLKGGNINLIATSNPQNSSNNDAISYKIPDAALGDTTSFMGVSISKTAASINIGNKSNIEGNNINIQTIANSDASTTGKGSGVGYGEATASATTTVSGGPNGATISATGNVNIGSNAVTQNSVKTKTVKLGAARNSKVDLTLAYTNTHTTSKTTIENGATVHAAGDMNIKALASKNITTSASAGAYADGTLGAAVAISNSESTTSANVGGDIQANKLSVIATTDNELLKTTSSASVGGSSSATTLVTGAKNLTSNAQNFLTSKKPEANTQSGSTTSLAISAALSYSKHSSDTTANIADGAKVQSIQDIGIKATNSYPIDETSGAKGVKSSAKATVKSNDQATKENSVAGAVTITQLTNTANAYIGKDAIVDAGNNIDIISKLYMPYEIPWENITSPSDIASHAKTLGTKDGYFTTWAQSSSSGKKVGAAGSVNFFHMTNDTESYIDTSSQINQNSVNDNYGLVRLLALTDIQTMNLSGVYGFKGAGSSGESGVGGSYLDVSYDDTTKARILDSAKVNADALTVVADSSTKNMSIAEAGTNAEKYGIAGTFSYLKINNMTHALIKNAEINTLNSIDNRDYNNNDNNYPSNAPQRNLYVKAYDYSKLLNISGGLIKAKNIGIGVSVSLNDITRDTSALIDSGIINGHGNSYIESTNDGLISAWSLAGVLNSALGSSSSQTAQNGAGKYGIGVSGDVSINNITDTTVAKIIDSTLDNNLHIASLSAKDISKIQSYSGSVALSDPSKKSVGLAGSYSQNTLQNNVSALVENSILNSSDLTVQATNTGEIDAYAASGSGQPNGAGIAGSVSINKITNPTTAAITGNSEVTSSGQVTVSSSDTPTINTIAGAAVIGGNLGIGASFAKNSIADSSTAYTDSSDISSQGKLNILADSISNITLYAATGAAALSGMAAAISVSINDIANTIKSWINGKGTNNLGVSSQDELNVKATDSTTIDANSGGVGAGSSAAVGVSALYNVIKNIIDAYISNATVNSGGNSQIVASSNKNIKTVSVGGALAGTASLAGSVVVNTIKDTTNSYIDNSIFNTPNSLSMEAMETNNITTWGGVLSLGGTFGGGGTAVVNDLANNIQTYISGNSQVNAEGTNPLSVLTGDGSGTAESIYGLDMLALGNENVQTDAVTAGGGGTVGLAGSVSTNILNDNILSYILGSSINFNNINPNIAQDVRVRARSNNDFDLKIGGAAIGGVAGVGASVDTTALNNKTLAYISGSTVYAQNRVQTNSNEQDRFNSIVVSGSLAGTVSLAGSVETFIVDNTNKSYIDTSSIYSNNNIDILAGNDIKIGTLKDGTKRGILVGGLSGAGAVGVGGSVLVTNVKQNVLAYLNKSATNAKGTTSIQSTANANLLSYIATAGIGGYTGAAGAVGVNSFDVTSQAYTSGNSIMNQDNYYKNTNQNVNINANSDSSIDSLSGSLGVSVGGGVGASIDVSKIVNKVLASVGTGTKLYAGDTLAVQAHSTKSDTSKVIAFGGGALLGVAGAVSIVNINNKLNSDASTAADTTKSSTNSQLSSNRANGKLGSNSDASEASDDINNKTLTDVNGVFDQATLPSSYTIARINSISSDPTTINTVGKTSVIANDDTTLNILSGSLGGGALGVGGGVGLGYINLASQAYIAPYADVTAGSLDVESNVATHNTEIQSYAGGAGAVGLGAAVAQLNIGYLDNSYIGDYSTINANNNIDLKSKSDLSSSLYGLGAAVGALAVGVVKATLTQSGKTSASVMNNAQLTSKKQDINVLASYQGDSSTKTQAAAGGIVSGSGSVSTTDVIPTVSANVGDGTTLNSKGDTQILSDAMGKITSEADGNNIGGITVGMSQSESDWTPNITTAIGSNTDITANNFYANAYENYDTSGNIDKNKIVSAISHTTVGTLVGGVGSSATATSDATVSTKIGNYTDITTTNDAQFSSQAYAKTTTESSGRAYGVAAGGSSDASSTNDASVSTNIGQYTNINAGKNISLLAYSRNEEKADTTGGSKGFINGTGADSKINISNSATVLLGDYSQLNAKNGDVSMQAVGYLDASAISDVLSEGAVTKNDTKSDVSIIQNITTDIGKNSKIEANNIDVQSRVDYLHASSSATSTTTDLDSKSHAIANTNLTSNTNLHIHPSAQLTGYKSVTLKALQNGVDISAQSTAKVSGATGTVIADATNNPQLNTLVQIDTGASISTNNLLVKAYVPPKSQDIYHIGADAKSTTIVNWVLTQFQVWVKTFYSIPFIGDFIKWVSKTVYKWVKHVLHSDTSSNINGDYTTSANILMNGNLHQIPSSPQSINVAANGAVTSQGEMQANISPNNININDLINHDVGKIVLDSSGELNGAGKIYISNAYPSVDITNHTNKNLTINNINTISDNSNQPNMELHSADGEDHTAFSILSQNPSHGLTIDNLGSGDIILNGAISNYGGDTAITNNFGNIYASSAALIKTKNLSLLANQGDIGTQANRVEVELQKSDSSNPYINSQSLDATYLGLRLSEFLNNKPASSYRISKAILNQILANGPIDIALHTGNIYYSQETTDSSTGDVTSTIVKTPRASLYSINNIDSKGNILINGESGVSLALDGTMQSGHKDLSVNVDNTDPSINSSPYLDTVTPTDIYLKPIVSQGGQVTVNLTDGTFNVNGTATLLDGYMHMNINNQTDKNLNLASITNDKANGSFLYNGSSLNFTPVGYSNGQVNITSSATTGRISMLGDILSPNGTVNITGNNGIFNPLDNYILANTVSLTTPNNTIGTLAKRMIVDGALSTTSNDDVFILNHGSSGLLIDKILAPGATAYLDSANTISDTDTNDLGVNIQAKNVELKAANDIGVSTNDAITLDVKNIAANSQNGAIYLKNSSDATVTTVGGVTGLHAANDISYKGMGTLTQANGADIVSDSASVGLNTNGNMLIDYIKAPQSITLTSNNGHIAENGDSATDIKTKNFIVSAANGIGDDGVTENAIDTDVERLDARNTKSNNLNIANLGDLELIDMNGDGYALYNSGGSINVSSGDSITLNGSSSVKTDSGNIFITAGADDSNNIGAFTQLTGSDIYGGNNIEINAIGDILLSYVQSAGDVSIFTRDGDILGDENILLNLNVYGKLNMLADAGVIGAPGNALSIAENNGGVFVQADTAKNLISVFINGINQPLDHNTDPDLSVYNNRPISGTLIDRYLEILYNENDIYNALDMNFQNTDRFKKPSDLIELSH